LKNRRQKRKQQRDKAHEMNRPNLTMTYPSPEYEHLTPKQQTIESDDDETYFDAESKSRSYSRLDKFSRFRVFEESRHNNRLREFHKNRRRSYHDRSMRPDHDEDDSKYQSCISLNVSDMTNSLSRTPKRSQSMNFFASHLVQTDRISDYYGHTQTLATPEVQLACSSNSATAQFFRNTIQAVGICLLVWNFIKESLRITPQKKS
jgi:hypothetical protein